MNLSIVVHKRNYINSKSIEQNSFENGSSRERESGNWNGNFEVTVTPLSLPIWTFSLRYIDDREDIRALCNTFAETLPTFIFHAGKIEKQTRWKKQDCQPRGKVTRGISNKMYENTAEVQPREFRFHVARTRRTNFEIAARYFYSYYSWGSERNQRSCRHTKLQSNTLKLWIAILLFVAGIKCNTPHIIFIE